MENDYGEVICKAVDTIVTSKLRNVNYDVTKVCQIIDNSQRKIGKYTVQENLIQYNAFSTITDLQIGDSVLVNIPYGDYNNQKTILNKIFQEDVVDYDSKTSFLSMLNFTKNIFLDNSTFSILANDGNTKTSKLLYSISNWKELYSVYTRLNITAKFQTWMDGIDIKKGTYGLSLIFTLEDDNRYELLLDTADMIGNPYKFNTFTEQSKIFDLTIMKDIKKLDIYLYQNNDFYTSDGTHFRWQDNENVAVTDNIFVSDIQIYLGFPENEFNGDSLTLTTSSSLAYSIFSNNPKTINIKWIHQIDDKNYTIITKENSSEYNINQIIWFRYELDQVASNSYSDITGPNWSVIPEAVGLLQYDFKPEPKKAVEKVKVLCSIITETGLIQNVLSNVIVFENEKSIVDQTTYNATLGLTINCEDDSGGNYFIYNSNGELINEGQGQGYIRTLVPCYQGIPLSNLQDDNIKEYRDGVQSIEWHIPKKNSMIVLTEEDIENRNVELDTNEYYVIKRERNDSGYINVNQSYSIKNYWHISNANNIIKCYIKNFAGIIFETTIELKFGKAGSNNSNITIILEFLNNNNALKINQEESIIVEAIAYDLSGKRITLDNNSEKTIKWHWLGQEDLTSSIISADIDNDNPARIKLTLKKNYDIVEQLKRNYHILQFEYSPTDSPKITTYLPIPIKDSSITYMEGARKVIYNPYGIPNYYTDAYVIYKNVGGTYIEETATWTLNSEKNYGNLKLKTIKKVKNGQSNSYYALQASTPYTKDDDLYCIVATQTINQQERVLWSQPILIMQSQYDAAIINDWDGDSIQLNENSGTIISSMLGAGTKDKDGYFSGILIGDLATSDESSLPSTGLYGLKNGVITFALDSEGRATFGEGKNISFGNSNLLESISSNLNFDVDNGKLNITNGNLKIGLSQNSGFQIIDNNEYVFDFSNNNLILSSPSGNLLFDLKNDTYFLRDPDNEDNLLIDSLNGEIHCNNLNVKNLQIFKEAKIPYLEADSIKTDYIKSNNIQSNNIENSESISSKNIEVSEQILSKFIEVSDLILSDTIENKKTLYSQSITVSNLICDDTITYKEQLLEDYIKSLINEALNNNNNNKG